MQKFKKKVTKKRLVKRGRGVPFISALNRAREAIIKENPQDPLSAAEIALKTFRGVEKVLSAIGALSGGAAGNAKAVDEAKDAKNKLEAMEAIGVGKTGIGLYLKPYKEGLGLYLKQCKQ